MFSFFESIAFESFCNLRIAFAVSLTAHSEVHTNFSSFTHEMSIQILNHLFIRRLSYANHVFCCESQFAIIFNFFEFFSRLTTLWAFFWSGVTFVNKTTNFANKFFHLIDFKS